MSRKVAKSLGTRQPRPKSDRGRLRLWPIGWVLALCFAAAVAGLAGLTWVALALLHYPKLPRPSTVSLHDLVAVMQIMLASVAGAGALVALVVAYRRQRVTETTAVHDRTRVLNERFIAITGQLGDPSAAVRLAGVHAMAGLADDWEESRQTCVDVLCAYLRMPYEPDPGENAPTAERLEFRANRDVRHTVIRVITNHLRPGATQSWQGLNLDFTGVVFDGGDFSGAVFAEGDVSFRDTIFSSGTVYFVSAQFSGAWVQFHGAQLSGGEVAFNSAEFTGGSVMFATAVLREGTADFRHAVFSGGRRPGGPAR